MKIDKHTEQAERKVWLQGVGFHAAKQAHEIQVGDRIVYNGGSSLPVISVERVSPKFVAIAVSSERMPGGIWTRRVKCDAMVPARAAEVSR